MTEPENRDALWDTICGLDGDLPARAPIRAGTTDQAEARVFTWPGPCTPLVELDPAHPARAYLESRGLDPDRLSRAYRVRYCEDSHYYLARNRIIIPVFEGDALRGWQARHVGELDWKDKSKHHPPKYFTAPGMKKRLLLYNLDRARRYRTGVVVEGVTDVWAFGPMAVCTFGNSMSEQQQRKFLAAFRERTAVLLYDPEAMAEPNARRLAADLAAALPGRFAAVTLPEGTDPGALGRPFLRAYVAEHAAQQGVKVSWTKIPTRSEKGAR